MEGGQGVTRVRLLLLLSATLLACARAEDARNPDNSPVTDQRTDATVSAALAQPPSPESTINQHFIDTTSLAVAPGQQFPTETQLNSIVRRISPSKFDSLPAIVREVLVTRRCLVPQPFMAKSPRNAILGSFTEKGVREWAVVCSIKDTSQILIVDAGNGAVKDSLGRSADTNWIQGMGERQWGFSRVLGVFHKELMQDWVQDDEGRPFPRPIDHDAINEGFLEKASVAYYRADGIWYRATTSD